MDNLPPTYADIVAALTATDSSQIDMLARLTASFEKHPSAIVSHFNTITAIISDATQVRATRWAAGVIELALCRPFLVSESKTTMAIESLGPLSRLVGSSDLNLVKVGIQCFASIYATIFKHVCAGNEQALWARTSALKTSVLQIWKMGSLGVKVAAVKVVQRIIQTQTKGTADPRLQRSAEPNLSLVRSNHPFLRASLLEEEANRLLEECITSLFTSSDPDLISAVTTALTGLIKSRPAFTNLIITAFTNWTPTGLVGLPNTQVRSVEKTFRIALPHLLKTAHAHAFSPQINEFLTLQAKRMELAEQEFRRLRDLEASKKRQLIDDQIASSAKRRRTDSDSRQLPSVAFDSESMSSSFDATAIALPTVIELIIVTLSTMTEAVLALATTQARQGFQTTTNIHSGAQPIEPNKYNSELSLKSEAVNPLSLDLGEDEIDLKAEPDPQEAESDEEDEPIDQAPLSFNRYPDDSAEVLLALEPLTTDAGRATYTSAMLRICHAGPNDSGPVVWASLVARLITRGLHNYDDAGDGTLEEDKPRKDKSKGDIRQILYDFVVADLKNRLILAGVWLHEEWYIEVLEGIKNPLGYCHWSEKVLNYLFQHATNKTKPFAQFIVDLPILSREQIEKLGDMCVRVDQAQIGYLALRDLALVRVQARRAALDVLLSLATHADKLTRNAAINTLKRWVPEIEPLSKEVVAFATSLLAKMEIKSDSTRHQLGNEMILDEEEIAEDQNEAPSIKDNSVEDQAISPQSKSYKAVVKDGKIIGGLAAPTTMNEVTQHVELSLALCAKHPDLLPLLFDSFSRCPHFVQQALLSLVTPMIRSLGVSHPKIHQIIETCPLGSEELVYRVLNLFLDAGRLPPQLIPFVRTLASARNLSPRVLLMIIGHCDKADVLRHIPRIVTILDNSPEQRTSVRSAFLSVITHPSQIFSAINAPKARNNEIFTPVELMVLLHRKEKQVGLKCAIEAIGICFSMSDAFRPEVFAAFMQQIVDEPELPVLFLRTAIQAITTYKTLESFASTTLLPRLVARKVWETPALWEGFIRCAKLVLPQSLSSLSQLPVEQLQDVVTRQPSLLPLLHEYVINKSSNTLANKEIVLEVLSGGKGNRMEGTASHTHPTLQFANGGAQAV